MSLATIYKPRSWAEVVGQEQALAVLDRCRQAGGLGGRAYWIAAGSGRGKTVIADLIADVGLGGRPSQAAFDLPGAVHVSTSAQGGIELRRQKQATASQ